MIGRIIIAGLLLGGCTAPEADVNENVPVHGAGQCDASAAQDLVGRMARGDLGAEALARTGARTIRWIQPNSAVTMDYRMDRLNIELDGNNRVTAIRCG